ncbi:MAG: hypothetical protein IJK42_09325 [Prevotella sp.]|nr:hypothetical protein [Prevotella sp.]
MKKNILLLVLAMGVLTACDPIKDEESFDVNSVTAETLLANSTFSQYSDAECTIPADNGNYIKFNCPNVPSLVIYYIKPDGSEGVLSTGKSGGVFNFVPKRGSDPNQTLYFRYVDQDGKEVVASKDFNLLVAADLKPEIKLLVSDAGKKVWKWDTSVNNQCWGNFAYKMGPAEDFVVNGANQWWGVPPEDLVGQLDHSDTHEATGEESSNAYMLFDEDGKIFTFNGDGKQIRTGSFSVDGYTGARDADDWSLGTLNTDAGTILFPFKINGGGFMPTSFEILQLTPAKLVLSYAAPDVQGGSWAEATFWRFYSDTDVLGCLSDNSEATWTWYDESGACWGNGGYGGLATGGISTLTGNSWWGVTSDGLNEQISNYGYGQADGAGATMTFTSDGLIKKSSGGSGAFAFDTDNKTDIGGWKEAKTWGRLTTTGDGILFPVRINAGTTTNEFDLVYFDDDYLILAYPNDAANTAIENQGSWAEGTFWRFKKQK